MPRLLVAIILSLAAGLAHAAALENQLRDHPSPYLAMHGEDPVAWQEWSAEALQRAREEHKLVYVSIGYFSCHWCHVMQRESYRDPEIAALLNRHFVPVKVDRELRPALDARLIEFVERTQGYSGWPLNVFLTPEGYPLVGIVYLPPNEFNSLLTNVHQRWAADRTELQRMARNAAQALGGGERSKGPELPAGLGGRLERRLIRRALEHADPIEGGFFEPNKFPMVPQMQALLGSVRRTSHQELQQFLGLTLDRMATQGLRDQLRGGFFRYVVDPSWQTPHFEKMLYDNALLAELYLRAARVLGAPRYADVARDTLVFMNRELRTDSGALRASLSAVDAKGVEGGFYVWDEQTLERLLTREQLRAVRLAWGMDTPPALEEGHLPVRARSAEEVAGEMNRPPPQVHTLLEAARQRLRQAQRRRGLPRDDKRLAGWNGLALRAFSRGAAHFDDVAFRSTARGIRDYLVDDLWDGERLLRARDADGEIGQAALEDYAYVASGLYAWAERFGGEADMAAVRRIVDQAWRRFHTPTGWRTAEEMLIEYGAVEAVVADGPMPSPSAVLVDVSLRLARRQGDAALERRALSALNVAHDTLSSEPFWFASQIRLIVREQHRPREIPRDLPGEAGPDQ